MRSTLSLLVVIVLVIGGFQAWSALRSPEDKIRGKLDDAVVAFNNTRLGPCIDLFGNDFVETEKGYSRDDVKSAIVAVFFREIDPQTKAFLYRVSVSEVEIFVEEVTATASFLVELRKQRAEQWDIHWAFRLEGELVDTDRDGWQFVKARVETVDGRLPR